VSAGDTGGVQGSFPLTFTNNTRGTWSNDQIYVLILGIGPDGKWSYVKPDGTLTHLNHNDEQAPGHLIKNGRNYATMSFTVSQADQLRIPPSIEGGRVYISLGSPMYIAITPIGDGWAGPDLTNPSDPNSDVIFDWYEFTYAYGKVAFGGNTTQVDMFGFPMTTRLVQDSAGYDQTRGITASRDEVRQSYLREVGPQFRGLVDDYRIIAPRSAPVFGPGGASADYMRGYIDRAWNQYATKGLTLSRLGETFSSKRVVGDRLEFMKNNNPSQVFHIDKPTTEDVMKCSGTLAKKGMAAEEGVMGAELCAAFNRGVALNPENWYNPSTYYKDPIRNDYAGFFHSISLGNYAYGFPYDDVNSQSSVQILSNTNVPTRLTIGIGW
jgi:hypothetical protein